MQLGLSSYTYTWAVGVPGSEPASPLSAKDLIKKSSSAGLGLLQIADNLPLETFPQDELLELARYAKQKKVTLEMGSRGLTPEHTIHCLNTAVLINSSILRMVIDSQGFTPDPESVISIIKELEPEFRFNDVRLALENHDRLKAREFEKIIQGVGSNMVGICLDSVNSMGAGEGFETVSEILLPYTINLHIKDFTISRVSHKMGLRIDGAPAGKGMLNIPDLVSRLNQSGICESAILELWTPPENDIASTIRKESEWAEQSIEYLKKLKWKS